MASLTLTFEATEAYASFVDTAIAIARRHGEEAAAEWAQKNLSDNFDLFFSIQTRRRPVLRVLQGGLSANG